MFKEIQPIASAAMATKAKDLPLRLFFLECWATPFSDPLAKAPAKTFSISMPSVALLSKLELFARMVMMYDVTKELWKYSALIEEEEKEW